MLPTFTKITERRHPEWVGNHLRWQWLLDSYEGDHTYRDNTYGVDIRGFPIHNLIRHKREYPIGRDGRFMPYVSGGYGGDPSVCAGDDDFQLRKARTPVPTFVSEAVDIHLARIYATEIKRDGPQSLKDWWGDVDGDGTSIDEWMRSEVAMLLRVFGQLDVCCDRPAVPPGEQVLSKADENRLKLNTCVATIILPMNMRWWSLDVKGNYLECVVTEPQDDGTCLFRHWTAQGWTLYDDKNEVIKSQPHAFGRVPIVRLFDRKDKRCRNVGKSWAEPLAIMQREYYNKDSELVLSDTLQAHPVLQLPEDMLTGDGDVAVGPEFILPMKKNNTGATSQYVGGTYLSPPKDGADSIRLNKHDIRDAADRYAALTKPAGSAGTSGSTVSQSGISKRLDATNGNDLLTKLASVLARAERKIAELAVNVLSNGKPSDTDIESIRTTYAGSFDLLTADDVAVAIEQFQVILGKVGATPETDKAAIKLYLGEWLQGLEDDQYDVIFKELDAYIDSRAEIRTTQANAGLDPNSGQPVIPPPPALTNPAASASAVAASSQ